MNEMDRSIGIAILILGEPPEKKLFRKHRYLWAYFQNEKAYGGSGGLSIAPS